ncbi:MAG: adenylate/guanylate cyclase domain-containing protein [Spirochaetota bacterium]
MIEKKIGKRRVINFRGSQTIVGGLSDEDKIGVLLDVSSKFSQVSHKEDLYNVLMTICQSIFECDNCTLRVWQESQLVPVKFLKDSIPPKRPLQGDEGYSGKTFSGNEPLLIPELFRFPEYVDDGEKTQCAMCVPINYLSDKLGVLAVESNTAYYYKEDDLEILKALGSQLGMALTTTDLIENLIEAREKEAKVLESLQKAKEEAEREKEKSEKLLLNILPKAVANELKENGQVIPVAFPSVTILFTDFKGFTSIASKMTPSKLLESLEGIFFQFDTICDRLHIEKLKTIGDAYMCASGIPVANHTHPIDICLAALQLQNFMKTLKEVKETIAGEEFWDMRLGVHTGPVVAGVVGKSRFAYDIWGDAVNIAARMESNGEAGKINISKNTYNLVKIFFNCEYRGKLPAKNKGMIDMYFLTRLKPEFSEDEDGILPNEEFYQIYSGAGELEE